MTSNFCFKHERAASSHVPPGWLIRTIKIIPSGTAHSKSGPPAYCFDITKSINKTLLSQGSALVKKTKNYMYLTPPAAHLTPPFGISIAVPTKAECLEIARRSYTAGGSWSGQVGGWPAWYEHEGSSKNGLHLLCQQDNAVILHKRRAPQSILYIGECDFWEIKIHKTDNGFAVVKGYEDD
jgi:5-methylcytosine-specific restriction protein A